MRIRANGTAFSQMVEVETDFAGVWSNDCKTFTKSA